MSERKRNIRISVRLTDEEHKALLQKCHVTGLCIEGMVRKLIADVNVEPRPPDSFLELNRQLSAIGNNLNQIARIVNSQGYATNQEIAECRRLMDEVWQRTREEI